MAIVACPSCCWRRCNGIPARARWTAAVWRWSWIVYSGIPAMRHARWCSFCSATLTVSKLTGVRLRLDSERGGAVAEITTISSLGTSGSVRLSGRSREGSVELGFYPEGVAGGAGRLTLYPGANGRGLVISVSDSGALMLSDPSGFGRRTIAPP